MRKGATKILLLLGLLVLFGLALVFFAEIEPGQKDSSKVAKAEKQEPELNLAQQKEKEVFSKKLMELKKNTNKLEKGDLNRFRTNSKKAFITLADLINTLSEQTGDLSEDVTEETVEIKKYAEKIVLLEEKEEIIESIKEGFESSKDALEEMKDDFDCENEKEKKFCQKVENDLDQIEKTIDQIKEENLRKKTREVFLQFHSLLKYMHDKMSNPEFLTMTDSEEQNNVEQNVNKTDEKMKKDKDSKCTEDKKCPCEKEHNKTKKEKTQKTD